MNANRNQLAAAVLADPKLVPVARASIEYEPMWPELLSDVQLKRLADAPQVVMVRNQGNNAHEAFSSA